VYLIEPMPLPSAGCASGSTRPKRPHTGSGVKASENRAENDRYGYLDSWVASSVLLGVTWSYAPRGTGDNRGNGAEECESDHTTSLGRLRSWLHPQPGAAAIRLLMTVAGDSAVIHTARGGGTTRRHARQRRSSTSSRAQIASWWASTRTSTWTPRRPWTPSVEPSRPRRSRPTPADSASSWSGRTRSGASPRSSRRPSALREPGDSRTRLPTVRRQAEDARHRRAAPCRACNVGQATLVRLTAPVSGASLPSVRWQRTVVVQPDESKLIGRARESVDRVHAEEWD